MPPNFDIYELTNNRNIEVINNFLAEFVDRTKCESRGEELMILKLELSERSRSWDDYDWEPAITLTHSIQRGLDTPRRCFSIYLPAKAPNIDRFILHFTRDDQLVLGLSVDDSAEKEVNMEIAKPLLEE